MGLAVYIAQQAFDFSNGDAGPKDNSAVAWFCCAQITVTLPISIRIFERS
jgi:hypothetical protein